MNTKFFKKFAVTAVAVSLLAVSMVGCIRDNVDDSDTPNGWMPDGGTSGNHFNPNINYGSVTDSRDGKTYRTVVIGSQTWMAEDLDYAGAGGDVGALCHGDVESRRCRKRGRFYRWVEAMNIDAIYETTSWSCSDVNHQGICPTGWHLPSSAEWDTLFTTVGGHSVAGRKLKSQTGWDCNIESDSNTDEYGFSALPNDDDCYNSIWWSATGSYMAMWYDVDYVADLSGGGCGWGWNNALSVRCVRDN